MHRLKSHNTSKMCLKIIILVCLLTAVFMAVAIPPVAAHKLIILVYTDGDTVVIEGAYDDGMVCNGATIEVFGPSGKKLLEGRADEDGRYEFKPPQRTELSIVLNAGLGHRAEHTIKASELPQ